MAVAERETEQQAHQEPQGSGTNDPERKAKGTKRDGKIIPNSDKEYNAIPVRGRGRPKGAKNKPKADGLFRRRGWRIEVTKHGKAYVYRTGSGDERRAKYGGTFKKLIRRHPERAAQYNRNKRKTNQTTDL